MDTAARRLRRRNLRMLAALAGLFLVPVLLAFFIYYGSDWRPARTVNHGELISPARPLPTVALPAAIDSAPAPSELFRHAWTLVYIGSGRCDEACRQTLYVMRQTRLSLNNDMTRVRRLFLVTRDCCDREFLLREHAGLVLLDASEPRAAALLAAFPDTERAHSLYVVDPLGNLMMRYDARRNPKGLFEDMKKLLGLSHIG